MLCFILPAGIFLTVFLSTPSLAQPFPNASTFDVFQYIDQFIGTLNGGNVFAGASLPYGMAKAVADVSGQNTAGFALDGSNVTGFSTMHDSGTGGNPSLGNFPIFPQFCPDDVLDNCKFPKYARAINYVEGSVKGNPGYFSLGLANGISAEMTTTQHTGLYRFTLPQGGSSNGSAGPLMLLDLTDLSDSRQNATISVSDDGRIKGNGTFIPSFGSGSYVLHFCVDFDGATVRDTGMWVNDRAGTEPKELFVTRGINLFYLNAGSWVRFQAPSDGTLSARVGMSFISSDQACQNAENEIPDWDFERVRGDAETAWREKLSPVSVERGPATDDQLTTFYSGLYRIFLNPQDYTNENPLWQGTEPYFDSFYCIWDSFRTQFPLLTILDPATYSRMLRSLLDTYIHTGWLPDCRMSLCKGFTQGGSNADIVFVDAYLKNVSGGVDYDLAYEALVNDAEHEPLDWSNEGRGGLQSWTRLGYIPALDYDYLGFGTNSRSISRTLEYAYNDFAVGTLGQALGKPDATTYLARSANWRNLFKADQRSIVNGTDSGFVGFFQPKYLNGTWGFQDPSDCGPLDSFCSLTSNPKETFEASIWEYQFFVPQSTASLISLLGGPSSFISRLQYLLSSGEFDPSNELAFLPPYLFHYAGRPGLSGATVQNLVNTYYDASQAPAGLPGNDDSGAGGAWVSWAMWGLFPVAGQDVYLIVPGFFGEVSVRNSITGLTSTARNVFPAGNGTGNGTAQNVYYIQSATLNGLPWTRNWIRHGEFFGGSAASNGSSNAANGTTVELELTLGTQESDWGTEDDDLPPSMDFGMSIAGGGGGMGMGLENYEAMGGRL